jgi:serine/threonine protein kinase
MFAVKTLRSKDRCKFNQEVNVLRKLSKDRHRHPHLITLLATYEQKQNFSLIFPLAKADLFGFWEHDKTPHHSASMARWIAEQCRGLAEALSRIHRWQTFSGSSVITEEDLECDSEAVVTPPAPQHEPSPTDRAPRNYFGRHGDLKPENILWYPNDDSSEFGILKITDFGIAQVSKDYSRKGVMPNSPTYRSPEFELQESYSPACDVWALGCVYLEFTAWYCGGHDLLNTFACQRLAFDEKFGEIKSDTFFTIHYLPEQPNVKEAKVKESVIAVSRPNCSGYWR